MVDSSAHLLFQQKLQGMCGDVRYEPLSPVAFNSPFYLFNAEGQPQTLTLTSSQAAGESTEGHTAVISDIVSNSGHVDTCGLQSITPFNSSAADLLRAAAQILLQLHRFFASWGQCRPLHMLTGLHKTLQVSTFVSPRQSDTPTTVIAVVLHVHAMCMYMPCSAVGRSEQLSLAFW